MNNRGIDKDELLLLAELTGAISVHEPVSIIREPVVILLDWQVFRVINNKVKTVHFVGYTGDEGRVSSAITSYDKKTRSGKSQSGRIYILEGDAGNNSDAGYTWDRWMAAAGSPEVIDITAKY